MNNKKTSIILVTISILLILVGIAVIFAPKINNVIYAKSISIKKEKFENYAEYEPVKYQELYQELKKRNEKLYQTNQRDLRDPFSYEEVNIDLAEYGIEENTIGYIRIPKMNVDLPILLGATEENMKKGAVHLTQTSYPVGGINTNCVIGAHRGYSLAKMFDDIEMLEIGDEVYIRNFMEELKYKVIKIDIISPTDISKLKIQKGKDLLTLITCHPYLVNTQRYVVYCERV